MPTYDILHKPTGEVTEKLMSFAELQKFLTENPEYEMIFRQMTVGDPVLLGVKKPPSDFIKHVIEPIEKRTFGHVRESKFGRPKREV